MKRHLAIHIGMLLFIAVSAVSLSADPCLVVYTNQPCVYLYDPTEYVLVGPGDPFYVPEYDRGGYCLVEYGSGEIDLSIYQAPNLMGFESSSGREGYRFLGNSFTLVVDGFRNQPTVFENVLVVFDRVEPSGCVPEIYVDGNEVTTGVYPIGDLVVSTPTPDGRNYSDFMTFEIEWSGCVSLEMWAFSDENYNETKDGGECFSAFSHDLTVVPTKDSSWGAIKAIFK